MKIAVIYQSKYGTTKQYAAWIAAELDADLIERASIKPQRLLDYDVVIYGGGLYAGGILGSKLVTKRPCKKLVLFTVGLADPNLTDYSPILNKNLPSELQKDTKIFHLRGGIDYKKLSIIHRIMMAMMKKMTMGKKTYEELSGEDKYFIDTYGKEVDFTNKDSITPLVDYVKSL